MKRVFLKCSLVPKDAIAIETLKSRPAHKYAALPAKSSTNVQRQIPDLFSQQSWDLPGKVWPKPQIHRLLWKFGWKLELSWSENELLGAVIILNIASESPCGCIFHPRQQTTSV